MSVVDIETHEVRGILLEMGAGIAQKNEKIPEFEIAPHIERTKLRYLLDLMVRAGLILKQLIEGVNYYAVNLNHRDEVYAIIRGQARLVVGKDGKSRVEKIEKNETSSAS